jgi:uncharacterized protein
MILKILLIVGIIALVYFIYKKSQSSAKNLKEETKDRANDMVECATCGIYCELDDAILSANRYYCSKECLEKKR